MTAIVHAHTRESRAQQRVLCGRDFRDMRGVHYLAMEWAQHDVSCADCLAALNGARPASCGPVAVDADGREVAP